MQLIKKEIHLNRQMKAALVLTGIALLYVLPLVVRGQYWGRLFNQAIINMMVVLGLNLLSGYLGLLNVGAVGMVAMGAYTSALLATRMGVPMLLGMMLSVITGVIIGVALGGPCLRLKGIYLVLMTQAFAEIVRTMLINLEPITNGAIGVKSIPAFSLFGFDLNTTMQQYVFFLTILIVAVLAVWRITHSKWGRVFLAIKDNDESVATCGINVTSVKIKAFIIAAILACVAGSMYAGMAGYICPNDFSGDLGTRYILMMMVGGWSNVFGSLLGAVLVTILPEILKILGDYYWAVFYMIVFIMAIIMPGGLVSLFTKGKTFNFDAFVKALGYKKRERRNLT